MIDQDIYFQGNSQQNFSILNDPVMLIELDSSNTL